jgi:phosphoserine phosphatase
MLKLAVFDLDGTLKEVRDPYAYLHRRLGVADEGLALIAQGMAGELSYEDWLRMDAELWRGTLQADLEGYLREIRYLPGARETVAALKARGVEVAIISAGLLFHSQLVAAELGIERYFGNEIYFVDEGLGPAVSGEVRAHVPLGGKGEVMARLQEELGVTPAESLSVGDTRDDIPVFRCAAVSVAVDPDRPEVAVAADIVLSRPDLRSLLERVHAYAPHLW